MNTLHLLSHQCRAADVGTNHRQGVIRLDVPGSPTGALPMFMTRHAPSGFEKTMFEANGVECPPHIVRSICKRQAEYFHGRLCAQLALYSLGITGTQIPSGTMGEPIWPNGVCGSITHNNSYALAVALRSEYVTGIGIDVETIADQETCAALRDIAVSVGELSYLRGLEGPLSMACLLTIVFSAKESFFKAAFASVRRYLEFNAVRVGLIDTVNGVIHLVVNEALAGPFQAGHVSRVHYRFLDDQTILTFLYC